MPAKEAQSRMQLCPNLPRDDIDDDETQAEPNSDDEPDCVCGSKDLRDWIACDNADCEVVWYHMNCMGLESVPAGQWLCPKCNPSRTPENRFDLRSYAMRTPIFPNLVKNDLTGEVNETQKKGMAEKKPTAEKAKPLFPNLVKTDLTGEETMTQQNGTAVKKPRTPLFPNLVKADRAGEENVAQKKGTAVKKPIPPKAKPKWKGWVELSEDEEKQFKEDVEGNWETTASPAGARKMSGRR